MKSEIVDSNVVLVANGQHQDVARASVAVCAQRLKAIMDGKSLVVDTGLLILGEYGNKTVPNTGNRPGDAFVKWALQNYRNANRVHRTELTAHPDRVFETFPDDPDLARFDDPDRKFVAVACAHGASPHILQAADTKWLGWNEALQWHGVVVESICRKDIARFQAQKAKAAPARAKPHRKGRTA